MRIALPRWLSGYWSSGQRLADSARVTGDGIEPGDLPEFMVRCYRIDRVQIYLKIYISAVVLKRARVQRLFAASEEKSVQLAKRRRNVKQEAA
jgi:hypothetical protein